MATAEQIKSLIKSHLQDDRERFLTTALQLAAYEAHKGHITLARDIRSIIDKQKTAHLKVVSFQKDLSDFIHSSQPQNRLASFMGDLKVEEIVSETTGLSHAEIVQACYDSVKEAILADQTTVSQKLLLNNIESK